MLAGIIGFSYAIFMLGSSGKYRSLSYRRSIYLYLAYEILIFLLYFSLSLASSSWSLDSFSMGPLGLNSFFFFFSPLYWGLLMFCVVERSRMPADHLETESELVSGVSCELGGAALMLYFLGEYLGILIICCYFILFFFGYDFLLFCITIIGFLSSRMWSNRFKALDYLDILWRDNFLLLSSFILCVNFYFFNYI